MPPQSIATATSIVASQARTEPVRRRLRNVDYVAMCSPFTFSDCTTDDAAELLRLYAMNGIGRGDFVHEVSMRFAAATLGHRWGRDKVSRVRRELIRVGLISVPQEGRRTFHQGRHFQAGRWHAQGGFIRLDCLLPGAHSSMPVLGKSFAINESDDVVRSVPSMNYEAGASNVLGAGGDALSVRSELVSFGNGAGHVLDAVIAPIEQYPKGVNDITAALLNARFSIDAAERDRWLARADSLAPVDDVVRQADGSVMVPHMPMYCQWNVVNCVQPACQSVAAKFRARAAAAEKAERESLAPVWSAAERAEAAAHVAAMREASLAFMFTNG
jgi:hypothetical protein